MKIECDLLFYCNGASVNRMKDEAFLQGVINEKNGRIIVRKSLQIQKEKCDNIFAFGDCADNAPQFAYIAGEQAKTVAHNIKVLSQGRETELKEFHMGKYAMVLTLGKKNGVSQLPGGIVVGGKITGSIKGKTLFAERYWQLLGYDTTPEQVTYFDDPSLSLKDTYLSEETLTRFAKNTGLTRYDLIGLISGNWEAEKQSENKPSDNSSVGQEELKENKETTETEEKTQ